MRRIEIQEQESSTGTTIATIAMAAVAGFAVGMFVAQRVGGFGGLAARLRPRRKSGEHRSRAEAFYEADGEGFLDEGLDTSLEHEIGDEFEDELLDDDEGAEEAEGAQGTGDASILEERVLEAFTNDPILSERGIDIGGIGEGAIELEGWVDDDSEAEHAVTLARGVPGVKSVSNRLMVDDGV